MVDELVIQALKDQRVSLAGLVARVALWAHPNVHRRLLKRHGMAAMFPNVRQARPERGEKPGQWQDGLLLDDHHHALAAMSLALGVSRPVLKGFVVCHVWPEAATTKEGHTAVANLVMLPEEALRWMSAEPRIQGALQYRASRLYRWQPRGVPQPERSEAYPRRWLEPYRDPVELGQEFPVLYNPGRSSQSSLKARLQRWSAKPESSVHRVLALLVKSPEGMARSELLQQIVALTGSRNPAALLHAMMVERSNSYGKILELRDTRICIREELWPEVEQRFGHQSHMSLALEF